MKKISINNEQLVIENFKLLFGYQLMMTKHKMVQEQENHKIDISFRVIVANLFKSFTIFVFKYIKPYNVIFIFVCDS